MSNDIFGYNYKTTPKGVKIRTPAINYSNLGNYIADSGKSLLQIPGNMKVLASEGINALDNAMYTYNPKTAGKQLAQHVTGKQPTPAKPTTPVKPTTPITEQQHQQMMADIDGKGRVVNPAPTNTKNTSAKNTSSKSNAGIVPASVATAYGTDLFSPDELKSFQANAGLTPDGIAGPKTKAYAKANGIPLTQAEYNTASGNAPAAEAPSMLTGAIGADGKPYYPDGTIIPYNPADYGRGSSATWNPQAEMGKMNYSLDANGQPVMNTLAGTSVGQQQTGFGSGAGLPGESNQSLSAMDKYYDLFKPVSKPYGGYGDAWNKGEGVLGGVSNMWDQFTAEGGSQMNPTASALEKSFGALGTAANIYGGVMDAKYKKDMMKLADRQQAFQEGQAARVNKMQDDAQANYNSSFLR